MIIDEAIGLSAVIINETVGDKINKANAVSYTHLTLPTKLEV